MKTVAAFALGFAAGMVCLAVVLWSTGSLPTGQVQAARTFPRRSVQDLKSTTASASSLRRSRLPSSRRAAVHRTRRAVAGHADRRSGPAHAAE